MTAERLRMFALNQGNLFSYYMHHSRFQLTLWLLTWFKEYCLVTFGPLDIATQFVHCFDEIAENLGETFHFPKEHIAV
ncbi:hypothetical protein P879_12023 [Paragonimus westermani]|uniref:Uncharacterized protein n=1 Tax=Paragonimus westermani TaxID=34504 RepID=A0A8T0D3N7_9TREM|nr:hypothetical protein P879_12023 [Paragonimus westermani]